MKFKGVFFSSVLIFAMLLLAACGSGNGSAAGDGEEGEVYTLKVATALAESDPIYQGLVTLKERVEERTNGEVVFEIFGNGSLGEDKDVLEQAKGGANVAVLTDGGRLAEMVPEIGILGAPYIVDSYEEANELVQSDLFKGWEEELAQEHGLQVLSFNWYQGDRHLLTNKEIEKPEDLQGVQLRTAGSPISLESMSAMGASPVGLAWSEVYPGLQQGVIDAAEAHHSATFGANLQEVISHITKTSHFQLLTGLVTGTNWMENLPQEYQEIVYEESLKAAEEASGNIVDSLAEYEQDLIDAGVEVNEVDIEPFKEATETVYAEFDGFEELREEINKILGK
ncbi:C4-dicarboxylate TRAP transporter substrate-binding protein [Oceanobacillus sojae]|uniref:C4-dicarboxylate TRAP transporter substrate-binding protein n=1 Tax=Oceanobacillus sojae TaxID=582851 RepID=UPI0009886CDF|nr:C4-dicarboxylate TRAP transporter substrate-binding protein [Oceanobacillus sojae]MCT1901682.1 C4-dicarboxylate TRAP transporter substrate-binding protein [Oceanobacillus sojae]